jgi:hypothetical protein
MNYATRRMADLQAPWISDDRLAGTCQHVNGWNLPTRKRAARNLTPRPVNDIWIAARCLAQEVPLATLHPKDYEDVTEHRGFRLLGSP